MVYGHPSQNGKPNIWKRKAEQTWNNDEQCNGFVENGVQQILIDYCVSSLTQFHCIYIYIHLVAIVGYTRIPHFQTYPPGKPMEKPWKKTVQYSKWLDGDIQQRHILI